MKRENAQTKKLKYAPDPDSEVGREMTESPIMANPDFHLNHVPKID